MYKAMTWAYIVYEQSCTGGGGVRDEEAAGSNPAIPNHGTGLRGEVPSRFRVIALAAIQLLYPAA
jgi:hypothetical protein